MRFRLTFWILSLAMTWHRNSLDRELLVHVRSCKKRGCRWIDLEKTNNLENVDEEMFCRDGKKIFVASFDLTESLGEMTRERILASV